MTPMTLLNATAIGDFIRYNSCERRLYLHPFRKDIEKELPFWSRFLNAYEVDVALLQSGKDKERAWKNTLDQAQLTALPTNSKSYDKAVTTWEGFLSSLATLPAGQNAYAQEVMVNGQINGFAINGQMDFVLVQWVDGKPHLRIVECKASRREATYQRIQLVLYLLLVRQKLPDLTIGGCALDTRQLTGVVARIDENTNKVQDILQLQALDLQAEEQDLRQLLRQGGKVETILQTPVSQLPFRLEPQCDDCVYNLHCLSESARLRRPELLGIHPAHARALQTAGILTIDQLATFDTTSPLAQTLRNNPDFAADLDTLVQKARVRRRNLPLPAGQATALEAEVKKAKVKKMPYRASGLPAYQHPNGEGTQQPLVRVYVSVTMDYVENRIVALAAHITNSLHHLHTPSGYEGDKRVFDPLVCEIPADTQAVDTATPAPLQGKSVVSRVQNGWTSDYNLNSEREEGILLRFLDDLYQAIGEVAAVGTEGVAPLHFYFWNRQEIKCLMQACSRSADTSLLARLRHLLGSRQGSQGEQFIYTCLADEVHRRYALGWTSTGLGAACSLPWFGRRFHWTRRVQGVVVDENNGETEPCVPHEIEPPVDK